MKFPWIFKATDKHESDEVTAPAQKEIARTQERLSHIERILNESRRAETLIKRVR